jgi:quercetin dioxygenase-like cupin family protein
MPGCIKVDGKTLLIQPDLVLALLRFQPHGTIQEHAADFEIDVVCLEGEGHTSVGDQVATFKAGQTVHWPALKEHRLWTGDSSMQTLMVEHPLQRPRRFRSARRSARSANRQDRP